MIKLNFQRHMFQSELLKIPEARQILPKEKQFTLKAHQLSPDIHSPLCFQNQTLKRLPQSVTLASFNSLQKQEILFQNTDQRRLSELASLNSSPSKYTALKQFHTNSSCKEYASLQQKYQSKDKTVNSDYFQLIYERKVNSNHKLDFAYEFVKRNFTELNSPEQSKDSKYAKEDQSFNLDIKHKLSISQTINNPIEKHKIQFDSHFQSGNLDKAFKKLKCSEQQTEQYHLWMQNDTNTEGYNQWYFFQVKNNEENCEQKTIKIRIVNFNKPQQLYQRNLRPWILNEQKQWTTLPDPAHFQQTQVVNPVTLKKYYELSFDIKIKNKSIYVALLPPYTYSRLCRFMEPLIFKQEEKCSSKKKQIGLHQTKKYRLHIQYVHSLLNNTIPILIFSLRQKQRLLSSRQISKQTKNVIIIGRQHPGQVWSSYLLEKIINTIQSQVALKQPKKWLTSKKKDQNVQLRFIIIPMINPDGVIYGNFRADYTGFDLNRVWLDTDKYLHPSIYSIKKVIQKYTRNKKPSDNLFFDIHSHSRHYGIFNYMCYKDTVQAQNQAKRFCESFAQTIQNYSYKPFFCLESCTFISQSQILKTDKKRTARAYFAEYSQISATIQISFDGFLQGKLLYKFQDNNFVNFSATLIQTIFNFFCEKNNQNQQIQVSKRIESKFKVNNQKQQSNSDSEPQQFYTKIQAKIINQETKSDTKMNNVNNDSIINYRKRLQFNKKLSAKQCNQKQLNFAQIVKRKIKIKTSQKHQFQNQKNKLFKNRQTEQLKQQVKGNWRLDQKNKILKLKQNFDKLIKKNSQICIVNISGQNMPRFPQQAQQMKSPVQKIIQIKNFASLSNCTPIFVNRINKSKQILNHHQANKQCKQHQNNNQSMNHSCEQKILTNKFVFNKKDRKQQQSLVEEQFKINFFQRQKQLYQKLKNRQRLLTQTSQSGSRFKKKMIIHRKIYSNSGINQSYEGTEQTNRSIKGKIRNQSVHKLSYF